MLIDSDRLTILIQLVSKIKYYLYKNECNSMGSSGNEKKCQGSQGCESTLLYGTLWYYLMEFLLYLDVCNGEVITITLTTGEYAYEISWTFGSCSSNQTYSSYQVYQIDCCQPVGNYLLRCVDSYEDGWNGGYIEIGHDSTQYCKDFNSKASEIQNVRHGTASITTTTTSTTTPSKCINILFVDSTHCVVLSTQWNFYVSSKNQFFT